MTTVEINADQLDQAQARLRSLNGQEQQLSFSVGLPGNQPDYGTVKISGNLGVVSDLARRQEVKVVVMDENGEILTQGRAEVTSIQFKDTTDKWGVVTTERIHTVSLA